MSVTAKPATARCRVTRDLKRLFITIILPFVTVMALCQAFRLWCAWKALSTDTPCRRSAPAWKSGGGNRQIIFVNGDNEDLSWESELSCESLFRRNFEDTKSNLSACCQFAWSMIVNCQWPALA